jgi:phosphoglycolate phosphatase
MPRPIIRILVTDLDNTLYDWVGFFAKAFAAMVDEAVLILEVDREVLLDDLKAVHQHNHESERPWSLAETNTATRRWPNADLAQRIILLDGAFHAFNRVRKNHLKLYPAVATTLRCIQTACVPIIGHTEATVPNALFRVRHLGVTDLFSRLYATASSNPDRSAEKPDCNFHERVISVPRVIHKPDPRVLLDICSEFGVVPQEVLYVGDSISRDIGMAQQIGMHAAWAAYGTHHDPKDWSTLVRVTHWTDEDVARTEAARERFGDAQPEVRLESFADILDHYEFRSRSDDNDGELERCG